MGGGIVGVRDGRGCQQKCEKKEAQDFDAAFYSSSPKPGLLVVLESTFFLTQMISSDAADLILDAGNWTQAPVNYTLWYREIARYICIFI